MKDLNTLEKFLNWEFVIERDGKVIGLTDEEIERFIDLHHVAEGHYSLEDLIEMDYDYEFAEKYLNNENVCRQIRLQVEDRIVDANPTILYDCAKEVVDMFEEIEEKKNER